jgi:cell division protein FtsL
MEHESSKECMKKPFTEKSLIRILTLVTITLALIAGYYYTQLKSAQKKYQKLDSRYQTEKTPQDKF